MKNNNNNKWRPNHSFARSRSNKQTLKHAAHALFRQNQINGRREQKVKGNDHMQISGHFMLSHTFLFALPLSTKSIDISTKVGWNQLFFQQISQLNWVRRNRLNFNRWICNEIWIYLGDFFFVKVDLWLIFPAGTKMMACQFWLFSLEVLFLRDVVFFEVSIDFEHV